MPTASVPMPRTAPLAPSASARTPSEAFTRLPRRSSSARSRCCLRLAGVDVGWFVLVAVLDEDPIRLERHTLAPRAFAHHGSAVLEQARRVAVVHDRDRLLAVGDVEVHALPCFGDRAGNHRSGDTEAVAAFAGPLRDGFGHRTEGHD